MTSNLRSTVDIDSDMVGKEIPGLCDNLMLSLNG